MLNYYRCLTEAGFTVDRAYFLGLNEAAQLKLTDDVLTKMMKFITDKYNALDFSEIEKSAGDYHRFKYRDLIAENLSTLDNIYEASTDPGADKYRQVIDSCHVVVSLLERNSVQFSTLYKGGNGFVQLLYTSLVAGLLYCIGTLISNTIRFVTVEQETDCQVLFDEIPGTIKHVHIKNIVSAAHDAATIEKLLAEFSKPARMSESVTLTAGAIAILVIGGVIILIPRIIVLIREIIYSIYYTRVKCADMLQLQIDLIKTNIESLEAGRGNKKIVARQKRIVDKLEKWKNRVAVKFDTVNTAVAMQKKQEDRTLSLDKNNPIVTSQEDFETSGLLI